MKKINGPRAMAITILFSVAICGAVFSIKWWMTDRFGEVDEKSSIADPPG
ncbi:hypothetical protein [Neorhizobium sp. DT-125]